jgi:hypothetical protein
MAHLVATRYCRFRNSFGVPSSKIHYPESGSAELDPKAWALILVGVILVKLPALISLILTLLASALEAVILQTSAAFCVHVSASLPLKVARVLASLVNVLAAIGWTFGCVWADVDLERIGDPIGEDVIASATWGGDSANKRLSWWDTDTGACGSARSS